MRALHAAPTGAVRLLRESPTWAVLALGTACAVLGAVLLVRPLTATTVLQWGATVTAVGVGLTLLGVRRTATATVPRRIGGIALLLLGCALVAVPWIMVPLLPVIVLLTAAVLATRRALGAGLDAPTREARWFPVALLAALLVPTVLLPGLAQLALATTFSIGLIAAGPLLVVAHRAAGSRRVAPSRSGRPMRIVARTLAGAVVAALCVGAVAVSTAPLRIDAFYSWSDARPAEPGVLLRSEPYEGTVPEGATAARILFTTTDAAGTIVLGSGLVALPTSPAPAAGRLVVAWQHGTTGVARECAPSLRDGALTPALIPGVEGAIERGWAVVATDYPGMGTAGDTPYLIGEGEGRAALDAVRAARQLDGSSLGADVLLWGHSQGGHATLWAGAIAPAYAPELRIRGAAGISAAADPLELARTITGEDASPLATVVSAYVLDAYAAAYPDIDPGESVDPAARSMVRAMAGRCVNDAGVLVAVGVAFAVSVDRPAFAFDLDEGPVHDRLAQNIATGELDAPLLLVQGTHDEVVPIGMQRDLAAGLCREQRVVESVEYPGLGHLSVVAPDSPLIAELLRWSDRVVAGEAPTTCPVTSPGAFAP